MFASDGIWDALSANVNSSSWYDFTFKGCFGNIEQGCVFKW